MTSMTMRWTVLLTLVLAGCTWPRDNPYDPGACPNGCAPGKACFEGRCVVLDSGATDQPGVDTAHPDLAPVDAAACTSAGQCANPPGPCHLSKGRCTEAGLCHYPFKGLTSDCVPADKCMTSGNCDGKGGCVGNKPMSCKLPHATGGACKGGACQGYTCHPGWGDCNGAWKDGCERPLTTTSDCGKCGHDCKAANATTACIGGACALASCTPPYKDCDKKYANGCEIPVGVANRCNKSGLAGLTSTGGPCGTAYCGTSAGSSVMNFTTWHCRFCATCHKFTPGYAWCNYIGTNAGNYTKSYCSACCISNNLDKVCK
jgi:hypothetical protein